MNEAFRLHEPLPALASPVLVGMLTGWIDASGAAAAAVGTVADVCDVRLLATFDGDQFIDYRARRPTMELREGVNTKLVWPEIELRVGHDPTGRDILVLSGPEPDAGWHRFATAVGDLAVELGVSLAVFLGAYPFATPHTRPCRLSSSSPSIELVTRLGLLRNSVDVPAGMGAVLEHALHDRGIEALGMWVQVPHYLGAMSYPDASVALLDGLGQVAGLSIDATLARNEAVIQRQRVDALVANNEEHQAMIRQLEAVYDSSGQQSPMSTRGDTSPPMSAGPIPTGDELAAEFEQYLRDQNN
jgi:hypothetical protein